MVNFLSIPKNQTGYYVLALLLCLFIALPIKIPHELAALLDSNLGKIVIAVIVLNMFLSHHVLGSIAIVAAYELIKRSAGYGNNISGISAKYVPTEGIKTGNLNKMNQFPITVEEIVIKDKIPYSFNIADSSALKTSFRPANEDTHDAKAI